MRKAVVAVLLAFCLLLGGCTSWMDGSYSSVNPHTERAPQTDDQTISVSGFQQLRGALEDLVERGAESILINVSQMDQDKVQAEMDRAAAYVMEYSPIGAYAVEDIVYEHGSSGGQPALAVTVTYNHNRAEINKIQKAEGMNRAREILAGALEQCESRLVMQVSRYQDTDLAQFVQDYMDENPELVMEMPQITVNMYPETGSERVVEVIITYQSSRESLRSMQAWVKPLFTSAELYVRGNAPDHEKYAQLYSFLMERNEYTFETSITPAYSLLIHGVGDSRAFAVVFSAMCRRAELDCLVVSGTCSGEPLFWNIICDDGSYYHVDLLKCSREGQFSWQTDEEMTGYVWDYSAYPECIAPETEPTQDQTEPEETENTSMEPTQEQTEPEETENVSTEPTQDQTAPEETENASTDPESEE